MSKYIIKSNRNIEKEYDHDIYNTKGEKLGSSTLLENGKTVLETLRIYSPCIVPFMKRNKLVSSVLEVEILKDDD
jgi:hypothetical protein